MLCTFIFTTSCSHETKNSSGSVDVDPNETSLKAAPVLIPDTVEINPTTSALLIEPGNRVGFSAIGEKGAELYKKLGRPDQGDAAMGKAVSTWISKKDSTVATTIYFTTDFADKDVASRVNQIRITSPAFMTAENIGVGSTKKEIEKIYGLVKRSGYYSSFINGDTISVYDHINKGIAFEINAKQKICVGISIHKPGDHAFQTYLNIIPGYISEQIR